MRRLRSLNYYLLTVTGIYLHSVILKSSDAGDYTNLVAHQNQHPFPVYPTAHIELFSYDRGTLQIVENRVNTEITLHRQPRYFEAYMFQCNSSYPIQWSYVGEGAPITTADIGRFFSDIYNVTSYTYQSILIMYKLYELQSGRYICKGMQPQYEQESVYFDVYVPADGKEVLLSTSTKTVFVPEYTEFVHIPCPVSDPTAEISLYKGNYMGAFHKLSTNKSINFDPRTGFKLGLSRLEDPYGIYLCTAAENTRRRRIKVIPEVLRERYDKKHVLHGEIPVHFSYDVENNRMLCCTGTPFVPKLEWAGCTSIIDCQLKSFCFEEKRCEQRVGNWSKTYSHDAWVDPVPHPAGCASWKLSDDPNGDMGLFKCSSPGVFQFQPYLLNRGYMFLDFVTAPSSEYIMTLTKVSTGPVIAGGEVELHCNGTRFYFGYGFRWAYELADGHYQFIKDSEIVSDRFFVTAHRRQTVIKIPHTEIKGIICFGPIINHATEWRTAYMPLHVQEAEQYSDYSEGELQPPSLDNYLDEINNQLYLEAASQPRKRVSVEVAGEDVVQYLEPLESGYIERIPEAFSQILVKEIPSATVTKQMLMPAGFFYSDKSPTPMSASTSNILYF